MRAFRIVLRNETALLRRDPYPILVLVAMPLAVLPFLSNSFIGGSGQAVPGLMLLFAFLGMYNVGLSFFRDHGWRTWSRMRTLHVPMSSVVTGKTVPIVLLYVAQSAVLLTAGWLFLDMPVRGSLWVLALTVVVIVTMLLSIGLALVTVCRTMSQYTAATNVGGLLLAGIGGALSAVDRLPSWAQAIAPLSPVYWATGALRGVLVRGESLPDIATALLVLLAWIVGCGVLAVVRFDSAAPKEMYA